MNLKQKSEAREGFEKTLYTGIFSGDVVWVNPDKAKLAELLGVEEDKIKEEPVYQGEKDGVDWVALNFWIEAPNGAKFNTRFRISDEVRMNKEKTKTEFVAVNGSNAWADDKKNLLSTFTNWSAWDKDAGKFLEVKDDNGKTIPREFREALMGETDLYNFLKKWVSHMDWYNPSENSILIDKKKLFRDPVKYAKDEYNSLIGRTGEEQVVDKIICLATVYVGEKDGNKVQYQNLANKAFLSDRVKDAQDNSVTMKKLNNLMSNKAWNSAEKTLKDWYKDITGEYGVKENYILQPLAEYDESKFLNESNETLSHSDATAPEDTSY